MLGRRGLRRPVLEGGRTTVIGGPNGFQIARPPPRVPQQHQQQQRDGLLSPLRIAHHVASSPVEHLALTFEFSSRCYDDIELLKTLRTQRSANPSHAALPARQQLGPSASAIRTNSDAIFFPGVVQSIMPMVHHLPAVGYELLLLLSRFYNSTEAKDTSNSVVGRQMAVLLDRVQQVSDDGGATMSRALAQVCFIANAALIDTAEDPRAAVLEAEVSKHVDLIPLSVLETLLTVSIPSLCRYFLLHTASRMTGAAEGFDGAFVFTLWSALLANDYFFNPRHFAEMHDCVMLLLTSMPPGTVRGAQGMVPVLNKTSRVYNLCLQGRAMLAVHSAFFGLHPEGLRLMPWQYHTRLIGGVFDDVSAAHELSPNGIAAREDAHAWEGLIVPVAKRFLSLYSTDAVAVSTLWKIMFKASLLFPNAMLSHVRAAGTYQLFIDGGVPQDMNKDQFAQLLRLFCEVVAAGEGPTGTGHRSGGALLDASEEALDAAILREWQGQLNLFCNVVTATPSATMHWGMNAVDTLLIALCQCPPLTSASLEPVGGDASPCTFAHVRRGMSDSTRSALGSQILSWLTTTFFVAKRVAATDPLNVSTIRKSLETLKVIPASPFWWACGCTASNSSHNDVCGKCMRNEHARWRCVNPTCGAMQRSSGSVCGTCGSAHPLIQAAERCDAPLCDKCVLTPLDEDLLCPKCDLPPPAKSSARHSGSNGPFVCSCCNHSHTSKIVCPKCGTKTNPEDPLGMWLCDQCGTYSYLFNKKCTRCASTAAAGGLRGRVRERTTTALRTDYQSWICGCGKPNPMMRLGCVWCGQNKAYTCHSCDRQSGFDQGKASVTVSTDVARNVTVPTSLCQHCGDLHPRDATVLANSSVSTNCYNCGGQCVVGADKCGHCQAALEGLNPFLPFWCSACEEGGSSPQTGYACAHCKTPRSEIQDCSYLWRCSPRGGDEASDGSSCSHWNPSWLSACESCGQSRAYDAEHEVRSRHCGQWRCGACDQTNEPSQVLICAHCDDGLHVPPPCGDCGRQHIAFDCPSEDMLAHAADILDGFRLEGAL